MEPVNIQEYEDLAFERLEADRAGLLSQRRRR